MSKGFEATDRATHGRGNEPGMAGRPGGNVESPQVPATAVDLGKATGRTPFGRTAGGVGLGQPGRNAEPPKVPASAVDLGRGGRP
jgi:hypothetical protein